MKTDNLYYKPLAHGQKSEKLICFDTFFSMFHHCHDKNFFFAGELHEPWEMIYVRAGKVGVTADDRVYHLGAGSLIFHKPLEFHQIWSESDDIQIFITSFTLSGKYAHRFYNKVFDLAEHEISLLETLLKEGEPLYGNEKDHTFHAFPAWQEHPILANQLVCRLELLLLGLLAHMETADPLFGHAPEMPSLYSKIVKILEEHVSGNITINEIAERCQVSPTTVKSCFAKYTGGGIHKYFLKIKLRTAISLLKQGKSVSEVSDRLSFNNPNYFAYVFRRETGKRPSDYKS